MSAMGKRTINRFGGEVMSDINVTPLVDIMLVLLIVFIITAPIIHQAFKLNLPKENAERLELQHTDVKIEISGEGAFSLNGVPISESELLMELQNIKFMSGDDTRLHLHADQTTQYTNIARVLALAQQAGLTKISFVTAPARQQREK